MLHAIAEHDKLIQTLSFSPDGDYLVSGSEDENVILWDFNSGYQLNRIKMDHPVSCLSFHPSEPFMAVGLSSGDCQIINARTGEKIRRFSGHSQALKSITYSKDGQRILTGGSDNKFILWHRRGRVIKSFAGHQGPVLALAFQDQNDRILSASQDLTARSWNYKADNTPKSIPLDNKILAMAEHPDASQHLLAVSMTGSTIVVIDQKSSKQTNVLQVPNGTKAISLAFHPNLGILYAGLENGAILSWKVNQQGVNRELFDPNVRVASDIDTVKTENDANRIKKVDTIFVSRAFVKDAKITVLAPANKWVPSALIA
ncbi:MAG: WD40 repeat domain-containing protein, partial [Bacteroidota bacterium]